MKLATAQHILIRECEFLGLKFEDLYRELEQYPLSFPLRTVEAFETYRELAYL